MVADDDAPEQSERDRPGPDRLIVFAVLFEGGLAPVALLAGWLLGQAPLSGFAWDAGDALIGVAATAPMLAFLGLTLRWPIGPFRRITRFFDAEVRPILGGRRWPDLALIALAAGVGEEMLFRGAIQGALTRWLGPAAGLATASLIFGLLHPITPGYIVIAALLGAYLGGVWLLTGNLLAAMVAHALYDFVALLIILQKRPAEAA